MHIIISVLAGQGVEHLLELFDIPQMARSFAAIATAPIAALLLLMWRDKR